MIECGHTEETVRVGGMSALGLRVIESQSPTTKIIENRFRFLQTIMAVIPGQIGSKRGQMEEATKIWTACRAGHRDPRDYWLSFDDVNDQIERALHYVNSEPVEGEIYNGIPEAVWSEGIAAAPLRQIDPARGHLFAPDKRTVTAAKGHLHIRFIRPDGTRSSWWFHHPDLWKLDGFRVSAYFDTYHPDAGATLVGAEGRHAGAVIGHADLIHGCPQFAVGTESIITDRDGVDRKREFMDAVRGEYRALGIAGQRIARVSRVDDGAGRAASISRGSAGTALSAHGRSEPQLDEGGKLMIEARKMRHARPAQLDEDEQIARVATLEAEARARGDILPV